MGWENHSSYQGHGYLEVRYSEVPLCICFTRIKTELTKIQIMHWNVLEMIWFCFISFIFIPRSQSKRKCITSLACCPDWQSSGVKRSDVIMLLRPLSCSARTCSFSNNSFLLLCGSTKYNNDDDGSKELFALGRFSFVRTDQPAHSHRNENFTFNHWN